MRPSEAKFDGAKGVRIPQAGNGNFRYQLKRGKKFIDNPEKVDFLEQLLWLMPDEEDPQLLWCNEDDQWFELEFNPIDKPYKCDQ
jgi:hypothetical protein